VSSLPVNSSLKSARTSAPQQPADGVELHESLHLAAGVGLDDEARVAAAMRRPEMVNSRAMISSSSSMAVMR